MIRLFHTIDGKPCGIVLQFGGTEGLDELIPEAKDNEVFQAFKKKSNLFPGIIGFLWSDDFGFNPGFVWHITQYGPLYGIRVSNHSFSLFGDRRLGAFA